MRYVYFEMKGSWEWRRTKEKGIAIHLAEFLDLIFATHELTSSATISLAFKDGPSLIRFKHTDEDRCLFMRPMSAKVVLPCISITNSLNIR